MAWKHAYDGCTFADGVVFDKVVAHECYGFNRGLYAFQFSGPDGSHFGSGCYFSSEAEALRNGQAWLDDLNAARATGAAS